MPRRQIVCLSPIAWRGLWTSRQALCRELAAAGHDVVFVDPPGNRFRRGTGAGVRASSPPPPQGVEVVTPPPFLPYGVLGAWPGVAARVIERNARTYATAVARAVHPGSGLVLLNSFMPVLGYRVAAAVRPDVHVYHRSDELRSFPSYREAYGALEARVARDADIVVAVSPAVRDGIAGVRDDVRVLPNGVDVERFRDARPDPRLAGLRRPLAVHVGVVDGRVDRSLLAAAGEVAAVAVVGPVAGDPLPAGVTAVGAVTAAEIPGLLAAADVGLVCYRDWPGDPLKIYEYLAAGLPVVSSDFPGLAELRDAVTVADDPAAFASAVHRAAGARGAAEDAARRDVAAARSWRARADELLALIEAVPAC